MINIFMLTSLNLIIQQCYEITEPLYRDYWKSKILNNMQGYTDYCILHNYHSNLLSYS